MMGLTSPCAWFRNEHLSVSNTTSPFFFFLFFYVEFTRISKIPCLSMHIRPAALRTQPIGRVAGTCMEIFYHLIPPIAVQCAGPSWQPL